MSNEEPLDLDYQKVNRELVTLFEATANKLEREWPARYANVDSARVIFYQSVRIAINTYNTILWICADTPKDPDRKPVYALSLAPLTRTLFEQLVMLLFLLEDVPQYIQLLFKTGYAARRAELDHVLKYHGSLPEWQDYIDALRKQIAVEEQEVQLTQAEIQHPESTIGKWPTPGKVLKRLRRDHPASPNIDFIEYLDSWMYRELSEQTHLEAHGLTQRGMFFSPDISRHLFGDTWEAVMDAHLERYRVKQVFTAIALMLAICSEIEVHFKYGLNQRLRYLWTYMSPSSGIIKDFWETKYSAYIPE
jgi:hypothetical protein